ncbi:MAG: DUF937 domain-containing protein [Pirellulales bacterium]|nr:DUF937 domain-containing protein [Pirellulales bacterium]
MNLVKDIVDRCSGDMLNQIGAKIGVDQDAAGDAVKAAVPAMLGGLASIASREDGAREITSAISSLGSSSMNDMAGMLRGDVDTLADRGSGLLSSLFGDGMIASLAGALGKYAGLTSGSIKSLLAMLAPMVLGKVASAWKAKGGTPQALTNLFAEQRHNIAEAMPAGFSLADAPDWSTAQRTAPSMATATADRYAHPDKPSAARWAVPLALGAIACLLLWSFLRPRDDAGAVADRPADQAQQEVTAMKPLAPAAPAATDVARINDELRDIFATAGKAFADMKDAASAEVARPQLEALNARIDGMQKTLAALPATSTESLRATADRSLAELEVQGAKTLETPGLSPELKTLIDGILQKLATLFSPSSP